MTRTSPGWVRTVAFDSLWIGLAIFLAGVVVAAALLSPYQREPHDGVVILEGGKEIPFKTAEEHDRIIAAHRGHIGGARYQMGYQQEWVEAYVLVMPFVVFAGYVAICDRKRLRSWFRLRWGWALAAIPLGLAAQAIAILYSDLAERVGLDFKGIGIYRELLSRSDFRVIAIGVAPVVEELYFRGRLYAVIEKSAGEKKAVLVTSAMFTLAHVWLAPATIPSYLLISFLLAWLRERTGGLVAPIVAHATINASAVWWSLAR